MTGMDDDIERQAPHGDIEILDQKTKTARDRRFVCIAVIISAVLTACLIFPFIYFPDDTHYFVAIDSAASDLISPTDGVSFNLTLGVASRSFGSKGCIEPGPLYLDVYYHGVQLARTDVEVGRLCAAPRKSAEQHVTARATAVPMGNLLDRLTADMKQGSAVFDITLNLPPGSYGVDDGENSLCKGSLVGAAAVWCDSPSQVDAAESAA